jgi:hypothetical protein
LIIFLQNHTGGESVLPFTEILTYFINQYGTVDYSVNVTITEFRDMQQTPYVIKNLNVKIDMNSLVSYIESLCVEVERENKGKAIDVIDKRTGKIINIIQADVIMYNSFQIEVSLTRID